MWIFWQIKLKQKNLSNYAVFAQCLDAGATIAVDITIESYLGL